MAMSNRRNKITLSDNPNLGVFQYQIGARVRERQTYHYGTILNGYCRQVGRKGQLRIAYMIHFDDGVRLIMSADAIEPIDS
jgi:hypothetical protein